MAINLLKSFLTLLNPLGLTFLTFVTREVGILESDTNATVSLIFCVIGHEQPVRLLICLSCQLERQAGQAAWGSSLAMLENCSIS